jgi:cyclopropane-fatty-acyl-phospholipid synthase
MKLFSYWQAFGRRFVFNLLSSLQDGQINLIDVDGSALSFGNPLAHPLLQATIQLNNPKVYTRLLQRGSIGAAESFMLGEWKTPDLISLLRVFIRNRDILFSLDGGFRQLVQKGLRALDYFKRNTQDQSRLNIQAHYDLGNDFFKLFLDPHLMYSSAIFEGTDGSLEAASEKKLQVICQTLDLKPHHHLIEIGTGWGGFAIYAATHYGCHVTTTTISKEQYQHTQARIQALGLEDKITLLEQDYRTLTGQYDRLVSIEMIEAVGYDFIGTFMNQCSQLLKPNGMALIQAIIRPDQNYDNNYKEVDFIKKYIFPGGCLVSTEFLLRQSAKQTDLRLYHLNDIGIDYAQTLNAWNKRFFAQQAQVHQQGFNEDFCRMWAYYFAYCEAAFLERYISAVQLTFTKPYYGIDTAE